MGSHLTFADANAKLEGARYSILGVPYDATTSFRPGARFGPDEIRKASYNFETWVNEWDVDLVEVPIHDFGNIGEHHHPEAMLTELESDVRQMVEAGAFPILLGGEHSLAPGAVRVLASKHRALKCLYVDAHLDFRPETPARRTPTRAPRAASRTSWAPRASSSSAFAQSSATNTRTPSGWAFAGPTPATSTRRGWNGRSTRRRRPWVRRGRFTYRLTWTATTRRLPPGSARQSPSESPTTT